MLDAKPTLAVEWNVMKERMQTGAPVVLHLDYLETTRLFVVLSYDHMKADVLTSLQEVAGEHVHVYTTDASYLPETLIAGLTVGKITKAKLPDVPRFMEASLQLALWADVKPLLVIAELDGPQWALLQEKLHVPVEGQLSVKDVLHRKMSEVQIEEVSARVTVPTHWGEFDFISFRDTFGQTHSALIKGDISTAEPVLMRVHSECFTGDIFGSKRCDCGEQLDYAMRMVAEEGRGVVLYTRQEGRGIGLLPKLNAYMLQDAGYDTVEANHHLGFPGDARDYTFMIQMIKELGIQRVRLISNNPRKWTGLGEYGIDVVERVPVHIEPGSHNDNYLKTKSRKLGHLLEHVDTGQQL